MPVRVGPHHGPPTGTTLRTCVSLVAGETDFRLTIQIVYI